MSKESLRRRYHRLKAAGLCTWCQKPSRPNRVHCQACHEKQRILLDRRYQQLKARGICICCGKAKAVPGQTACEAHLGRGRTLNCAQCGGARERRHHLCAGCLETRRKKNRRQTQIERDKRRLAAGLCIVCGRQPHEPQKMKCAACLQKQRDRMNALNARRRDEIANV